jgi:hypothetical protein
MELSEDTCDRLDQKAEQDFKRRARELFARAPKPFGPEGRQAYSALRRILLSTDE